MSAIDPGAISSERFLLNAERCITFHNERPGKFPIWIEDSWHNCLAGCFQCQKICQQKISLLDWIEGGYAFSEEETTLILNSASLHGFSSETTKKLEQLGLKEYLSVLLCNLNILLEREYLNFCVS